MGWTTRAQVSRGLSLGKVGRALAVGFGVVLVVVVAAAVGAGRWVAAAMLVGWSRLAMRIVVAAVITVRVVAPTIQGQRGRRRALAGAGDVSVTAPEGTPRAYVITLSRSSK